MACMVQDEYGVEVKVWSVQSGMVRGTDRGARLNDALAGEEHTAHAARPQK